MSDVVTEQSDVLAKRDALAADCREDMTRLATEITADEASLVGKRQRYQDIARLLNSITGKPAVASDRPAVRAAYTGKRRGRKPISEGGSPNKRKLQPNNGPLATGYTIEPVVDDWETPRPAAE